MSFRLPTSSSSGPSTRARTCILFRALGRLKRDARFRDLKLVKVGAPGGREAAFREQTLAALRSSGLARDDVVFFERVPVEDLAAYYAGAECLVLPSLHEGFGLPVLEAMACGCPVVVSNVTALPEVVGDSGLLVDPTDADAIADAVAAVVDDGGVGESLRRRGLARAAGFTWERAAAETVRVYERLAEQRAGRRGSSEDDLPLRSEPRSGPMASDGV